MQINGDFASNGDPAMIASDSPLKKPLLLKGDIFGVKFLSNKAWSKVGLTENLGKTQILSLKISLSP